MIYDVNKYLYTKINPSSSINTYMLIALQSHKNKNKVKVYLAGKLLILLFFQECLEVLKVLKALFGHPLGVRSTILNATESLA